MLLANVPNCLEPVLSSIMVLRPRRPSPPKNGVFAAVRWTIRIQRIAPSRSTLPLLSPSPRLPVEVDARSPTGDGCRNGFVTANHEQEWVVFRHGPLLVSTPGVAAYCMQAYALNECGRNEDIWTYYSVGQIDLPELCSSQCPKRGHSQSSSRSNYPTEDSMSRNLPRKRAPRATAIKAHPNQYTMDHFELARRKSTSNDCTKLLAIVRIRRYPPPVLPRHRYRCNSSQPSCF